MYKGWDSLNEVSIEICLWLVTQVFGDSVNQCGHVTLVEISRVRNLNTAHPVD